MHDHIFIQDILSPKTKLIQEAHDCKMAGHGGQRRTLASRGKGGEGVYAVLPNLSTGEGTKRTTIRVIAIHPDSCTTLGHG